MKTEPSPSEILVIGELNVDLVATGLPAAPQLGREILARDFQLVLGSASAIFACGAARLGHRVTFVSRVGDDYFGRFCLAELRAKGVSTRRVKRDAATRTGVTVALSTAQDRALVTFLGAIAELSEKDIPANIWRGRKHLHLTSYFLQDGLRPAFPRLMAEARRNGLTVSFDPNSAPGQTWPGEIWQAIGQTEILLCNEDEARQLTGARTAQAAGRKLREHSPCVVVKCGKRGAWGWRRGMETHSPAFPAQILDTTGAGDSFAAGFVHGFLSGKNLPDCLTLGNACGALSAQGAGGTAGQPGQETLKKFLAHHGRTHS